MRVFPAALVLVLLAGCSSSGANFSQSRDKMSIDPGSWEEINLNLKQGATIAYTWTSSQTLHFNVHSHENGKVIEWVKADAKSGSGTFTADYDGVFSVLWENNGRTLSSVTYSVTAEGTKA